jgi:N-acetylglucosamine-6-phosphate deacetylase
MIFTNARVVLPDRIADDVEVVCTGREITEVRTAAGDGIDLGGNYLVPGFVDVHVHGAVGRDTMEGSAEAFSAICDYHATGGTTSLLLTTATAPLAEITRVLETIRSVQRDMPQVAGAHVEGPFISRERAGAQSPEFICSPIADKVAQLLDFADVVKRVTVAPELPGAVDAITSFVARDVAVSGGHSDAWDDDVQAAFDRGLRHTTHTFNCMSSARRRGTQRVAGLLEFALGEPEITCELIADGHHVSPTLMKMLYRAKGVDGICLVTDATAGAGLPDGQRFSLAGTDCVVRDGACYLADGSALAGSAARMIDLVRTMVNVVGVPLDEALTMASANPARAAGLQTKGKIAPGYAADFVVLSPELDVLETWLAGERVFALQR